MQRFNGQLINQFPNTVNGNAAAGAQVTIRVKSSGALAALYATDSLSGGTLPNPITADAKGYYGFYAPDGVYTLDVNIAGTPQLEIQLQDVASLKAQFDNAVLNAGYIPSGTFASGATLTQVNQVLSDGSSFWRWDGALPKTVTAGSAPTPVGVGGWFLVAGNYVSKPLLEDVNSTQIIAGVQAKDLINQVQSAESKADAAVAKSAIEPTNSLQQISGFQARQLQLINGIKSLIAISGISMSVKGFYAGGSIGGGDFYYDPDVSKSMHNGGTFIAPEAISAWDGTHGDISTLLNWVGPGSGCFVRVFDNVRLQDFGAVLNGLYSDTEPFKALIKYVQNNRIVSRDNMGTALITEKLNFRNTYGWGISGNSPTSFKVLQQADNTAIYDLGVISGDAMYEYEISNTAFDYVNVQPVTNTNANPIKFSAMGFQGKLDDLRFLRGSWAIKVASGIGGPWGQDWGNLVFSSGLTGGAMDWTGAVNSVPNNRWGRFLVECQNMAGPLFRNVKGYNWTLDNLELLSATNCQWFEFQAASELWVGALKCELFTYSGTLAFNGNALIYAPNCAVRIEQLHLGGTVATFNTANSLSLLNSSTGNIEIGFLNTILTAAPSNFFLSTCSGGSVEIRYNKRGAFPVNDYTNVGGTTSSEFVTVYPDKNEKLSANKGDANYVIAKGDPSLIIFQTALTAARTVDLPADNSCFNGLQYKIISNGAVNGANTITIRGNALTKGVLSSDKTFLEFTWRRNATPHAGWLITDSGTIP